MAVSRVRRPKHFEKMLADMCQDPERRVFAAYKDALIFAACLGYAREKRVPFEGTSERVHLEAFTGPHDLDLVNVLALAETGGSGSRLSSSISSWRHSSNPSFTPSQSWWPSPWPSRGAC